MIGERWSLRVDGIVLAVVTSLAVVATVRQPAPHASVTPAPRSVELSNEVAKLDLALHECADEMPRRLGCPSPAPAATDPIRRQADQLYRLKQFGDASTLILDAAHGNHDLESLATLYHQLDRAWAAAMAPGGRATEQFEALDQARKLDLVLGGAFCNELQVKTIIVAPRAAISYATSQKYDEAEHAVAVAEAFGVNSETIKLVRKKLRQVHLHATR